MMFAEEIAEKPHMVGEIISVQSRNDGYDLSFKFLDTRNLVWSDSSCWARKSDCGSFVPEIGHAIRHYYSGGMYTGNIRGMAIAGHVLFYRTEAEENTRQEMLHIRREEQQKEEFEKGREKLDKDFFGLPQIFQDRIMKFRLTNPDFRWKEEAYEMICCTQAMVLVNQLKTVEAINVWKDLDWKKQIEEVPEWSDGHSGNTASMSVYLAKAYLTDLDSVFMAHGALTPLLGCVDYGCPHGEQLQRLVADGHFQALSPEFKTLVASWKSRQTEQ